MTLVAIVFMLQTEVTTLTRGTAITSLTRHKGKTIVSIFVVMIAIMLLLLVLLQGYDYDYYYHYHYCFFFYYCYYDYAYDSEHETCLKPTPNPFKGTLNSLKDPQLIEAAILCRYLSISISASISISIYSL